MLVSCWAWHVRRFPLLSAIRCSTVVLFDSNESLPVVVPADVVDDFDDIFAQNALWEGNG